jgi:hypothetical protein
MLSLGDDRADADANRGRESAKVTNAIGNANAPDLSPNPQNPFISRKNIVQAGFDLIV